MSNRIQAPDPLLGATPALRPTARPLNLQIGATPQPTRSPLMELADSFGNVNAELRDLLRDTAAREEKDAQALGEIEAGRLLAEKRISELDRVLKDKVDKGELPAVRLPAAQRAASLRIGHEHAEVGLQTYLLSKKEEAVRGKPEDIDALIQKGYEEFGKAIGPDAFFERQGFERAAQEIVGQFRQRVAQEQAIEAEKFQRETRANEGSELLFQLATADAATAPVARDLVKSHLDAIRGEMPKSEVTPFFTANVLKPTVARLIEAKNFDAAAQLLDSLKGLDLTGKGGLYGKTAEGGTAIMELSALVEQKAKYARGAAADVLRDEVYTAETQGRLAAAEIIAKARQENGGNLPPGARQRIISENVNGLSPLAAQTFGQIVQSEYENQERFALNPQAGAKLVSRADTLDPKALDLVEAEANLLLAGGEISAEVYHRATQTMRRNRALADAVEERDVSDFMRAAFAVPNPNGIRGATTINLGDDSLVELWDGLREEQRTGLRVAASDAFVENFRQQIRTLSQGLPENVPGIKAQAFDKASTAARETATSLLAQTKRTQAADAARAQVVKHAASLRHASAVQFPSRSLLSQLSGATLEPSIKYEVRESVPKGIKDAPTKRVTFVPRAGAELSKAIAAQATTPQAEWDVVATPSWFADTRATQSALKLPQVLDLAVLADEIKAEGQPTDAGAGNPERVAIARRFYGIAKSLLGFTPEEIKAGVTKHGVTFVASDIDWKTIPVFRSVAELEKEWNRGDFTERFGELGDTIDPKHTMHPQDFYLAQLALLQRK